MKTKLLITLLIAFAGIIRAQIPNGTFQNWTPMTGYDMPVDWDNLNPLTASQSVFTCQQGMQKSTGNLYLRLISDSVAGFGVAPGIAVCGKLDPITLKPKSGFPCTQRPTALSGKWQFMAMGNDPGFIAIYFSKWNSSTKKRDLIGTGVDTLKGMEMAWANFSIPISFSSSAIPDSCIIFLSSSGTTPIQYSYLYVDDLAFETSSGVLETKASLQNFKCFPNPVNDLLKLDLHTLKEVQTVEVINMQGQIVFSSISSSVINEIDVSNYTPGIYIITVQSRDGLSTQKFNKF